MATATWDRGRNAKKPSEIPKTGWKDTLYRVKNEIKEDRLSMVAAAMAYYALFSIVPAISSVVLIYAWFSDPNEISQHLQSVSKFLPQDMMTFMNTTLKSLASKASSSLGVGALATLALSLWSASKASKSLIDAMNIIYDEKEDRGFFKYTGLALGLTLLAVVLCILALAVVVGLPAMTEFFNFGTAFEAGVGVLSWVILLGLFSLFLAAAYRYSPNRRNAQWKWVSWGAVIASVLWAVTSGLFSWYAKEFADFNKTYGTMGAAIALMTWFYLSSYVILLGAEINAEMEHQTSKDTTVGGKRPIGTRKATMADTVGADFNQTKKAPQ
ncbi:MAG TPA: YihY/virulence factor BrkB family protein [Bacteriovoracaceae bacterium]|nr:YihY/virulence factor BrkB family protein [Bacteriovoracaceae bacterium]